MLKWMEKFWELTIIKKFSLYKCVFLWAKNASKRHFFSVPPVKIAQKMPNVNVEKRVSVLFFFFTCQRHTKNHRLFSFFPFFVDNLVTDQLASRRVPLLFLYLSPFDNVICEKWRNEWMLKCSCCHSVCWPGDRFNERCRCVVLFCSVLSCKENVCSGWRTEWMNESLSVSCAEESSEAVFDMSLFPPPSLQSPVLFC